MAGFLSGPLGPNRPAVVCASTTARCVTTSASTARIRLCASTPRRTMRYWRFSTTAHGRGRLVQ